MSSLKLVTAEHLVESREEAPPWILKPFLMRGSSMMLYGRQGIGKSSLVAQLAHSFISGEPWLGFPIEETGPVVWLQFDMAVEEARRLIERAQDAGMDFQQQLYTPAPDEELGEQVPTFNIYNPEHEQALLSVLRQVKPVAVILDTADDGYESPQHKSVVEVAREVVKKYRRAAGHAAFIFLRHERKRSSYQRDEDDDDPDAFSGPKEWEAVASSSLQLKATREGGYVLRVRKSRLDRAPLSALRMDKDDYGFFLPKQGHAQMLQFWPACVPQQDREAVVAGAHSMNDVFRDVAERSGTNFEVVKKTYQRARGVDWAWSSLLSENGKGTK